MKPKAIIVAAQLLVASALNAAEFHAVTCEGTYPHHLQGICVDKDWIYWSFTTALVKTDLDGKPLKKVTNHHGDLCFYDGKIYVAVNLGKFNVRARAHLVHETNSDLPDGHRG